MVDDIIRMKYFMKDTFEPHHGTGISSLEFRLLDQIAVEHMERFGILNIFEGITVRKI